MAPVDPLRPTVEERVAVAISSRNLTLREGGCPLDKVIALGIASQEHELADPVLALRYANDRRAYPAMLASMRRLAHRLNKDRRLEPRLKGIARVVLDYWLNDLCEPCTGLGFQKIAGSPVLAGKVCDACHGEGKRPKPWVTLPPKLPRDVNDKQAMAQYERQLSRKRSVERFHRKLLVELDRAERKVVRRLTGLLR